MRKNITDDDNTQAEFVVRTTTTMMMHGIGSDDGKNIIGNDNGGEIQNAKIVMV